MRGIILFLCAVWATLGLNAQILTPVKWKTSFQEAGAGEFDLVWTAEIDVGWSIYSQHTPEGGPVPTSFHFDEGEHFTRIGEVVESGGKRKEGMDAIFEMVVIKFVEGPVTFTQRVKVRKFDHPISGHLTYMTCDDTKCLPPTEEAFSFVLPAPAPVEAAGTAEVEKPEAPEKTGVPPAPPAESPVRQDTTQAPPPQSGGKNPAPNDLPASPEKEGIFPVDFNPGQDPVGACGVTGAVTTGKSFWNIFLLGFLGGLVALLTPCVFPMIPLTVSFFTKSSRDKRKGISNAILYGLFIFLVYLLLSLPFHLMDSLNPDILNDISTNVWLNVAFFLIFLFFAFSFFGYYEITLPGSWTNKASAGEGIGGMIGIFFMALTLALVSFSCTGPILGSLLAGALTSDGGAMQLTMGMGGFGMALALPFALFAAFPGWLNALPKSGGWLNTVKVVLGFIELALALKFLSNADLVKHWGLLKIEPFLGLWILIGLGLTLYLFGIIRFPHDSPMEKLSRPRLLSGIVAAGFVLYLASGFLYDEPAGSYRPLKLLSGLAPPSCYSWFNPCDCPQNLNCFKNLDDGLAYAREHNKPILLDFTGYACVNCRKMEEHVWPVKQVYQYLKDNYVLISLYVDDKRELPEDEQQVVFSKATGANRKLRTLGHKWSYFQTEFFNTNTQPYYVLLSPEGDLLTHPAGYMPDPGEYSDFLKCGLDNYRGLYPTDK